MIRMINAITGSTMWVHESRLDEYTAAGHKLAASDAKPAEEKPKSKTKTAKKK